MRAAALLLLALPAGAAVELLPYTPPSRSFSCLVPAGWTAFEQATPLGTAAHIWGPEGPAGWRPAYHIHVVEKNKPGWRDPRQMLKELRRSDDASDRAPTALSSWRVAHKSARLFEVHERRMTPAGRLPAEALGVHHFYAYVPGVGADYLIVKLTTREDDYLEYRREFMRFLDSLRLLGY
jgi:hypothetical protein